MAARLSALRVGRPLPPRKIRGTQLVAHYFTFFPIGQTASFPFPYVVTLYPLQLWQCRPVATHCLISVCLTQQMLLGGDGDSERSDCCRGWHEADITCRSARLCCKQQF
jgi:hypothetical protein